MRGLMSNGLQKVCLAQADAGMDIKRIVDRRTAFRRCSDGARRPAGDIVRTPLAETFKGQAGIKRGAGEPVIRLVIQGGLCRAGRVVFRLLHLGRRDTQGAALENINPPDRCIFPLPQLKQPVAIMGLDPALQEYGRHGKTDNAGRALLKRDPGEPGIEDFLTLVHFEGGP